MGVKQLFDLTGKTALVTGGSRGLGLQMAEALGEMGAKLALVSRKQEELDEAVRHLGSQGIEASGHAADLSSPEAVDPLLDRAAAALGNRVDILVNNAGATWGAATAEHPLPAWLKVIGLNLTATFLLTQAVGRRFMIPAGQGKVVTVASIAGLKGNRPGSTATIAYNTSKGGLISFTRALATEWAPHGITVNAIAPGFFPSKMTRGTLDKHGERIIANVPLGRIGNDEDLKGLAVLLCSAASGWITGQTIVIDGGVTAL